MGIDITGFGSVADFADGLLDRFWPKKMTAEERAEVSSKLENAIAKRDLARDAVKGEVMKAELKQSDNYTKRARPTVVYAGLAMIGINHVLFPMIMYISSMLNGVNLKELPVLALPEQFWYTWGGVCSIWIIGRSAERTSKGNKIISAITGSTS